MAFARTLPSRGFGEHAAHLAIIAASALASLFVHQHRLRAPAPPVRRPLLLPAREIIAPAVSDRAAFAAVVVGALFIGWARLLLWWRPPAADMLAGAGEFVDELIAEANASATQPLHGAELTRLREVLIEALGLGTRDLAARHADLGPALRAHNPRELLLRCRVHVLCERARAARERDKAADTSGGSGDAEEAEPPSEAVCKVCWGQRANAALAPCGHVVACLECIRQLHHMRCPVCTADVADVVYLYPA